ncbi:MAG: YraN family protein [Planctomycetes bacterium]|nr:YraN family protein [Planctomycetota bacterium]
MQKVLRSLRLDQSLGARGERAAARHLKQAGYRILARNMRTKLGEIDLLALAPDGKTIVIVEVKSASGDGVPPEVHVNNHKRRKLTALASELARRKKWTDRAIRFDVVAVVLPPRGAAVIRHHVGAFESVV